MTGKVIVEKKFEIVMTEREIMALVSILGHGCQRGHRNNGVPQDEAEMSNDLYSSLARIRKGG